MIDHSNSSFIISTYLGSNSIPVLKLMFQVYKSWVNQTESETGQAAGLPYDVTQVRI